MTNMAFTTRALRSGKKSILSLLLAVAFASVSAAAPVLRTVASEQSPSAESLATATLADSQAVSEGVSEGVSEVVSELDRQADLVFQDFRKTNPQVPFSILKHAQREAVYRLRQMHVITDILKASGPTTATTIIATEILTNFILAPMAAVFGKPALAGALLTVPWGLVAGFGVFSYQMFKLRLDLVRSLKVSSLKPLDRIRDLVVGYDLKFRVSTIVYQSMEGDIGGVEFEILRKAIDFSAAKVPAVTIAELENIVNETSAGASYLSTVYVEKIDPAFYSALLLRYVNSREESLGRLVTLVESRISKQMTEASVSPSSLRKHLVAVSDVRAKLDRDIKSAMTSKGTLRKRLKSGDISTDDVKALKMFFTSELARLRDLRKELSKHEYSVLAEAQTDLEVNPDQSNALLAIAAQVRVQDLPRTSQAPEMQTCVDVFAVGF